MTRDCRKLPKNAFSRFSANKRADFGLWGAGKGLWGKTGSATDRQDSARRRQKSAKVGFRDSRFGRDRAGGGSPGGHRSHKASSQKPRSDGPRRRHVGSHGGRPHRRTPSCRFLPLFVNLRKAAIAEGDFALQGTSVAPGGEIRGGKKRQICGRGAARAAMWSGFGVRVSGGDEPRPDPQISQMAQKGMGGGAMGDGDLESERPHHQTAEVTRREGTAGNGAD